MRLNFIALISLILVVAAVTECYPQRAHECLLTLKRYSSAAELDDEATGPELVGQFEMNGPSEGTKRNLSFPVKNSRLMVFVDILYDDNLEYYAEWLHDGINMTMRVTDQGSKELSKSLAVTTGQVEDRKDFLQASFGTLVPYKKQWYDFWLICRQKDSVKQKELEKAIEDARKEESAKDNQKGAKPKASPRGK